MRRIVGIEQHGGEAADTVRLDFDRRSRRRAVLETVNGRTLLLDMPRPAYLRDGDLLRLDDDVLVRVEAADEALIEIAAADSAALVRVAWHLGNRHLLTQLVPGPDGGTLRIRSDHVIAEMAVGLGARCMALEAPFDPEGGAYSGEPNGAPSHRHDHHDHDESHGHHDH